MHNTASGGRLTPADRTAIQQAWEKRIRNRGTISALAVQFGVSHVAISNIILAHTGKRPNAHECPSKSRKSQFSQ